MAAGAAIFSFHWRSPVSFRDTWDPLFPNDQNTKISQTHLEVANNIKCVSIYIYICVSVYVCNCFPLCLTCWIADVRWVRGMKLFIEWSDPFFPHTIHLSSPPWQFSLGTGFNIGQNAICIYISFFIRPCSLSPLKTLGIWRKSVAANLKIGDTASPAFAFAFKNVLYIYFSVPCYSALLSLSINIMLLS